MHSCCFPFIYYNFFISALPLPALPLIRNKEDGTEDGHVRSLIISDIETLGWNCQLEELEREGNTEQEGGEGEVNDFWDEENGK